MCHTRVHGDISGFGSMLFRADSEGTIIGNIYAPDIKLQQWINNGGTHILDPSFRDDYTDPALVASVLPELISENLIGVAPNYSLRPGEKHNLFGPLSFEGGGGFYSMTSHEPEKRQIAENNITTNPVTGRPLLHESEFPFLDVQRCSTRATGKVTLGDGTVLNSPINTNTILVNGRHVTSASPTDSADSYNSYDVTCPASQTLTVQGEVVVNGDLVLAGCMKGQGTFYVSGNIYIPDDLKNVQSAFPFTETTDKNILKQEATERSQRDLISLATEKFIVIGAIRFEVISHEQQEGGVFRNNKSEIENVYNWLTQGSSSQNLSLYTNAFLKRKLFNQTHRGTGAVSLVEANLFANKGIAASMTGIYNTNLVINGSLLTPNISMLVSGWSHNTGVNPFNSRPFANSEINQDFRLKYTTKGFECHRSVGN